MGMNLAFVGLGWSSCHRTAGLRRPQWYGRHSQTDATQTCTTFTDDRTSHYKRVSVIYITNPHGSLFNTSKYLLLATLASWPDLDSRSGSDFYSRSPDQLFSLTNSAQRVPASNYLFLTPSFPFLAVLHNLQSPPKYYSIPMPSPITHYT